MRRAPHLISRVASLGLAAVLLGMTGFAMWAAVTTQQCAHTAQRSVQHGALYQQARYAVAQEASIQREYWASGGSGGLSRFHATTDLLTQTLRRLQRDGEQDDQAFASRVLVLQSRYLTAASRFFAAVHAHRGIRAARLDATVIAPLLPVMAQTVETAATREQIVTDRALASLDRADALVGAVAPLVFVLGLLLLAMFWNVMRLYRGRLDATVRAEFARLEQAALTDHLTGLGNHRAFQEALPRALAHGERHDQPVTLVLVDVDEFKVLNDQHGHVQGDRVLTRLAALLRSGRAGDHVFRLGGDEFALILPHTTPGGATTAMERLRCQAEQSLGGTTISVGLAASTGERLDEALREQAQAALLEAKRRGRNAVVSFEQVKDSVSITSAAKISAVRRLLSGGHIGVAFQPIWDAERNSILAFEALARPDPAYGLAGPLEAFDIADGLGRAHELDALCRQAILQRAAELPPAALLFLNVSPQALDHDLLAGTALVEAVTAAGLTPNRVVLEITERSLVRLPVVVREAKRLRALGFRLALDDVGAGNAGLEMLRYLPVEFVKIDRDVVSAALVDTTARAVLAAIIAFAREARSLVIAEGIETEEMLALVRHGVGADASRGGVHALQGYLLGRPSDTLPDATPVGRIALPTPENAA